jgi:hypothetical protein
VEIIFFEVERGVCKMAEEKQGARQEGGVVVGVCGWAEGGGGGETHFFTQCKVAGRIEGGERGGAGLCVRGKRPERGTTTKNALKS